MTSHELSAAEKRTGTQLRPVFISVDPERDTAPKVKAYVKTFHPRLIGLTGPVEKVCSRPFLAPPMHAGCTCCV